MGRDIITTVIIEPIIRRLVLLLIRRENLVACKRAREEEVNGINENGIASQGTQQHQQHQQYQHFDEVPRLLILLRGAIDNITVSCLSSGINDSCELCEGQDLDDKRTTMTIPSHQQHRDDDVIRMANGTASILRDILLQRQIYTAKKNDKVSSSIEVMLHQSRYNACMEEAALTLTSLWRMIVPFVAQDGVASQQSATANDSNSAAPAANYGGNGDSNNDERVIVTIVEEFVLPSLDVGRGVKIECNKNIFSSSSSGLLLSSLYCWLIISLQLLLRILEKS